ncbi:MAG: DEAD/DEAH box helicase [Bacteroidales bacterium]|nr:DEAD/DEAH box helicase [Bacteroidales bacterium]
MKTEQAIETQIAKLKETLDRKELAMGEILFHNGACQILSQSQSMYELLMTTENGQEPAEYQLMIDPENGNITPVVKNQPQEWDSHAYACLLQVESELHLLDPGTHQEHKKYTRRGMIRRVLKERRQKAESAEYRIQWADNIYGDHILTNEKGVKYTVFLRDFESETGYSNSMDSRINKLGTTKHIMYAFNQLKQDTSLYNRLSKTFPFIEIYCDPLNDYRISWYYPHELPLEEKLLISRYFKRNTFIEDREALGLLPFMKVISGNKKIRVRPEVQEKMEQAFDDHMLKELEKRHRPDFSKLKIELFPYQKEGIAFALFRKAAIIADEMGLGKTVQAIGTAILKKKVFGFRKTLVVCPASLKEQWKKEIEKFSDERALVVQGFPHERAEQYEDDRQYFFIVNYEMVMRDQRPINRAGFDFLILDEAQRAKNYETKTAGSLKRLEVKHKLVITGTPIENRLIDIFSIMGILDPHFLGPLWEFSYQHCLFDPVRYNKINGYYNLKSLNEKLGSILIRREKSKVIDQLPNVQQVDIPVQLSPLQADYHASYARGLAQILRKRYLTPYDMQRMQLLLANMRMVCDSTFLIDGETNESPKLEELKYVLLEKLDIKNTRRKIIIFSEWVKVHKLIGRMLRENNIGFVELNGMIPVKSRGDLIRKFEDNDQYKVFLSTEAGGSGLNLQVADILINFELPWNPARKNQRIGRIDRLGQKSNKLTIFNFITKDSIEQQIASGLLVKQSLFDGVLGKDAARDMVDFSTKGRSQFIQQLEEFISGTERREAPLEEEMPEEFAAEDQMSMEAVAQGEPDLPGDAGTETSPAEKVPESVPEQTRIAAAEMEQVMNHGMQFLAGMFKMSTGKELGMENQSISIDKETGEVVMKFRLPV